MDRPLVHRHGDSAPCLVAGLHYQDQDSGLETILEFKCSIVNYMNRRSIILWTFLIIACETTIKINDEY